MTDEDASLWKALSKIYPVSLTADRYSGSYSRGAWVAQVGVFYDSPDLGDTEAMMFWDTPPPGVAADNDPIKALRKALESYNEENSIDE